MQTEAGTTHVVLVTWQRDPARTLGIVSCVFGVLGILTFGILFVPLAVLFATFGLFWGLSGKSASGIGFSLLGAFLSALGFLVSPTLWAAAAAGFTALLIVLANPIHRSSEAASQATSVPSQEMQAAKTSELEISDLKNKSATLSSFFNALQIFNKDVESHMGKADEILKAYYELSDRVVYIERYRTIDYRSDTYNLNVKIDSVNQEVQEYKENFEKANRKVTELLPKAKSFCASLPLKLHSFEALPQYQSAQANCRQ